MSDFKLVGLSGLSGAGKTIGALEYFETTIDQSNSSVIFGPLQLRFAEITMKLKLPDVKSHTKSQEENPNLVIIPVFQ